MCVTTRLEAEPTSRVQFVADLWADTRMRDSVLQCRARGAIAALAAWHTAGDRDLYRELHFLSLLAHGRTITEGE